MHRHNRYRKRKTGKSWEPEHLRFPGGRERVIIHRLPYTWADDEVRKKREADIMADKKKSSRTKVIWKIKTILRNPRFISFFDGVRGTKIDKVYTFIAYDLLDYGLLYFVQRLLRKIRK